MDTEIKDMLVKLLDGQTRLETEVKESIEVLKDMTGRHEVDSNILKLRPV